MWNSNMTLFSWFSENLVDVPTCCGVMLPASVSPPNTSLWVALAALASPLCQDNCKASALRLCGCAQPRQLRGWTWVKHTRLKNGCARCRSKVFMIVLCNLKGIWITTVFRNTNRCSLCFGGQAPLTGSVKGLLPSHSWKLSICWVSYW